MLHSSDSDCVICLFCSYYFISCNSVIFCTEFILHDIMLLMEFLPCYVLVSDSVCVVCSFCHYNFYLP